MPDAGFAGEKNGRLLELAEKSGFNVFLTVDRGLQYQQNMTGRKIAVAIIRASSNRLSDILPSLEKICQGLLAIKLGDVAVLNE